jgi:hypothetical protein
MRFRHSPIPEFPNAVGPATDSRELSHGGSLTAWELSGYDATITRFELVPGLVPIKGI